MAWFNQRHALDDHGTTPPCVSPRREDLAVASVAAARTMR
jgi:hypothetical protein